MSTHCRATPLTEQRRSRGASRGSRRSHEPVAEGRRQSIMQDAWLGARECSRAPPEDGPTPSLFEDSRLTGDRPGDSQVDGTHLGVLFASTNHASRT